MKALSLALLFTSAAFAQTTVPEIRGIVAEIGTRAPLAGATVTLYEFAPNEQNLMVRKVTATTTTPPDGTFAFRPGHLGRFMVGVAKDGYTSGGNPSDPPLVMADLDQKTLVQSIRLLLTRPGTITGRVIDRDGNPVANLHVGLDPIHKPGETFWPGAVSSAVTNAEGVFTEQSLTPGNYILSIAPQRRDEKAASEGEELAAFTDADFKAIDEDVEPSYWPGGVPSPEQVLPLQVPGGGIANVGTITIRKVPYYRVWVSYKGDCAPNERWTFQVRPAIADRNQPVEQRFASCRNDALLTRLAPGTYELVLWSGRGMTRWAQVPFSIKDQNVEVPLILNDGARITGRVTTPSGGPDLKTLGPIQVVIRSSQGLPSTKTFAPVQDGLFTFDSVPWKSQWASVMTLNPNVYVKEMRYNGLPLRTPDIEASNGSTIDIVVDEGAASLNVLLKEGDTPAGGFVVLANASLSDLPPVRPPFEPFLFISEIREGPITLKNIPPGEYRLIAAPLAQLDQMLDDQTALSARFSQATKVTLTRGEQKSIEIQLKP